MSALAATALTKPAFPGRPQMPPPRWIGAGLILAALALLLWWMLSATKVEERARQEDVEVFDLAVPPPPPPPPVPQEVEKIQETNQVEAAEAVQPIERDPLTPPQQTSPNPPAGDLSSLLQDPTADAGGFVGGARGQGGSGSGPLIGGIGGGGKAGASRAYADLVQRAMVRHLRKRPELASAIYTAQVRVRVNGAGVVEILGLSGLTQGELEPKLMKALRSFTRVETPPPAGVPNQITIRLNQA